MSDSIQVAIKVRPLIKREKDENLQIQWAVVDNAIVPVDPEKKRGELSFQFDHIFSPEKTNNDVFETVVKPIVDAAVKGFNGTVFAYGQTSSGKTHTMLGTPNELGVIPMAVERTFDSIADTSGREFLLRVSYLEIYNEKVNDLLDTSGTDLKLREDSNGLVQVLKCKEEIASSPDVIMNIMKKGDKNRRIGETDMNDRSSRSHTIFRITIESRDLSSDSDGAIQVSQLNLVDLAGSERARQTNATGERFKEGTHINMSLSTLGLVIKQLSESSDSTKYVNFRDSKLTRLLQASLGGNAMTTIICAVTPAAFEETQCTLSFASRAKSVKNKPTVNEVMSDAVLLKRYKKQLAKLNEELEKLKNVNRIAEVEEMESKLQEKEHKLQETDRMNQLLEERIELLKTGIISADSATKEETNSKIPRSKRRRTWAGDRGLKNSRFSLGARNLPTIKEMCTSPESKSNEKSDNMRRRKSIIQSVNFNEESFQTAFTDFEMELIKVAKEREEESDVTIDCVEERDSRKIKPRTGNRVQFQDDVEIYRLSSGSNWSETSTPDKRGSILSQGDRTQESTASPGTPKSVLRERLSYITEEYKALQEFTTLERQILSAQQDFDSPNEKIFMQQQIDGLLQRLQKYSSYQTELEEQLTLSLSCINRLSSRTPDVLELWKPSLFSDDRGEIDTISELKQLEKLLENLKSEQNNGERALSPLEKELTDNYNVCLEELEQVKSQKELLFQENAEIKKQLADESKKLQSANTLMNTLKTDTDCLMEKLIQKNSELSKLKERIVELEKVEVEKSSNNVLEVSTKSSEQVSDESNSVPEASQDKNAEIARLSEIIEEKTQEITKYRQFEEEMKLENERLQQSLDAYLKVERESQACQTDVAQEQNSEITNLSEMIKNQTSSITAYQHLETELQQKVDHLQQCLDAVSKVGKYSQECQTDDVDGQCDNSLPVEQNKEISRLTEVIQEKILELANSQQLEKELRQEIERLQTGGAVSKVETKNEGCQTLYFNDIEEDIVIQKDLVISRLEGVIQEITLEITRYKKSEEDAKQEIERLQLRLGDAVDKISEECQTEDISDITSIDKDKSNEISGLLELIQLKSSEIERYHKSEEEMKMEIQQLQQCLATIKQVERISVECQTKRLTEIFDEADLNKIEGEDVSSQTAIVQDTVFEIKNLREKEKALREENDRLIARLSVIRDGADDISVQCQTDIIEKLNEDEKDIKIVEQLKIIDKKTLEIEEYRRLEDTLRNEIAQLKHLYDQEQSQPTSVEPIEPEHVHDADAADKLSELSKNVLEKEAEIEQYKQNEQEIRNELERLQQSLNNAQTSSNLEKDEEISKLSEIIQEKELEITRSKQNEEQARTEIQRLQQCLDTITNVERKSADCQTESVSNTKEHNHAEAMTERDNEIARLSQVVEEKTQQVDAYKQSVEIKIQEIDHLKQLLENASKAELASQEIQTEEVSPLDSEAEAKELETANQIKAYQEEIEALKNQADISREGSATAIAELETKVTSLNEELSAKIKNLEELNALNTALKNGIDEKNDEISNLQRSFESKVQELEQKIDAIVLERNELKEKIDAVHTNDVAYNFEKEAAKLRDMVDKLKLENEHLKQRLQSYETECNKNNLSINEKSISTGTPVKTCAASSTSAFNSSIMSPIVKLEENSLPKHAVEENVPKSLDDHSFVKPESVLMNESKVSAPVTTKDDKSFVQSQQKKFELESSSIFANLSYFDNMEVSQSSVQDSTSIFTAVDESKNISNMSANIDNSLASQASQNTTVVDVSVLHENNKDISKSEDIQSVSVKGESAPLTMEDLEKIKLALEKENARLSYDLEKKIRETEEVQRVVSNVKQTLEELQQTIYILTNENMDMSKQLTEARENNSVVVSDFQREIDDLTARLSAITEEKVSLKNELALLNEQYENARATTPVITDDDMKHKFFEYQEKIKTLTEENIELSTSLMEKIEELEKVKESKIQLYDHECTYKEKAEALTEKIDGLEKENIELSSDLTEQIEECDKLKETVDVMKQQLEAYAAQQSSENTSDNDLKFFKQENARLTSELIELRAKLTQLNRENANLSNDLALNNSDEHNESTNSSRGKTLNASSIALETSINEGNANDTHNISSMTKKVKSLQEQVEHLTMLNKKLGELKLTNCNQCAHLKELNESRRELKLEVKALNQKLADLQKQFQQKCADTEALRAKANEDLNASLSMMDSTLNGSIYDGINVTVIEEKVQNLHSELEELKENHNKLSNQYKEKCNELEKLQYDNTLGSPPERKDTKRSKADSSSRKSSTRIQNLQKDLEKLSNDLQELKKVNTNTSTALNKFMIERNETMQEIESLKLSNEELKKECSTAQASALHQEEKVKLLEEELSTLYKRIEVANATEKEIQSQKLEIEVQLESLLKEKTELVNSVHDVEDKFKKELENCNARLHNYDRENNDLKNELQKLEDLVQQLKGKNESALEEKLKKEIESAKSRMMKEIGSLTSLSEAEQKALPKKPVTDIFVSFLNAILSKEQEIIKRLQEEFERKIRKIEEEKQQSIDSAKRANIWAKTLETDNEKLQGDLTEQEHKNKKLQSEAHRLEENLKEAYHENQQLHNRISNLESDLNSLQNELDKKSRSNVERDSAISVAQEKERLAKTREEEWEERLAHEKEKHTQEIEELNSQLELYRSTNEDLRNTVEGLDLEIEHLKNTVNIKADDLAASLRRIEELQKELEQMEDIHHQLKSENLEKIKHVEDITGLLKIKCDLLTEYKTKVETMKPEYESLQAQIAERKIAIEKCKEEIHALKLENKKQADILQDKLNDEEIKSAGLNKQVAELKNKNTALYSTIEEFKDRCAELERENASLQRKVRNSTSKVRVENEMQELQDENRSLKNHLEGSYNRIKELQESKSQVQRELAEVQGKCELLEQDLNTTKNALESLREKYNNVNLQKLREKYETLLREKNSIVLEVEEKKMLIANKDQKLVEYGIEMDTLVKQKEALNNEMQNIRKEKSLLENQITNLLDNMEKFKAGKLVADIEKDEAYKLIVEEKNQLSLELQNSRQEISELLTKNKELDEEMDDLVNHIHKQENEIAELHDRLITGSAGGSLEKLKSLEDENEKLKIDLRVTELNCSKLQTEIIRLNSEKEQLNSRIDDLVNKIGELESKNSSRCSSKSNSPTTQKGRRRHRRSDLYNQNRNLDNDTRDVTDTDSPSVTPTPPLINTIDEDCRTCTELRNRIREMSLDLVSRNQKITMLEVQLQAENFPYQMKCNELQEQLLQVKTRNSELKLEAQKLQRALMKDSSRECQVCRQKKLRKTEQAVQVNMDNKISMTGMSSGIVEDHIRLEKMEKERNWMKDLCRSRARRIKELEQRIGELEGVKIS